MTHANRGKWLESAIEHAAEVAAVRGEGSLVKLATPYVLPREGTERRFIRRRSTVDFVGCVDGRAVAFDAKATARKSLPHRNVHPHQIQWLKEWSRAGGVGSLLVGFSATPIVYLVGLDWYLAALADRVKSIPEKAMEVALANPAHVVHVVRGGRGYSLDWVGAFRTHIKAL